ncbi:SDR family NAD(P)-dependent oxidoreductase [Actinoplanes subtropicus]|uniref:SDR family NAD(P)-dependent oxidoreductase n=1 Tax=Actinoplanes subtropicus TaxID=543632 RepID=UPI0004C31FA1|nr:SDR family oxidoreductase [Actinoplanes subtropicus]
MTAPDFRLDGRVALVTGTSTGLGERFARVLGAAGAAVVLASRRAEPNATLAASLRDALPVTCDVRRDEDRAALVAAALDRYGQIDVLVNNAGIASSTPAEDENLDSVRDLLDTNTVGLFGMTQLVGRHMLDRGQGSIVNVASPSATISLDRYPLAGYAASKGAVVALTRELAAQWAGRGVRVNALSPCFFPSNTTGWLADPDQVAWISGRTPIGRPPRPDELDGPLLFLASVASSYVTGQNLVVDGGWTTR